ncbi:ABC transporter ATP-binding protein [Borrelia miyamotoi]|uniref:ABC transporter ATP-binding protein n=1 Tax=Borrelia miyamotoi TaxID=47466 RepID=A0AAX3JMH4_9SPIR|nr:ABC transporter ATP-binding protein [Borrelia miyamotoi]QFP42216.1 ABC transporter ATP-binding protein [Borrelia miyamotoi]QFP48330.1 ABC transporter ATP-binding protein [Borrelia miyamotoi]QGT56091.1 ATP-binding cassette domain-containing protein [Borrelia miyamotoi]QGT56871.1 ATP-binding cassette domain-containing protein [Borrelia miyamotoi]WAZ72135.1 ABC transporter ATP-binding protein [Borrelia miyamotoi]
MTNILCIKEVHKTYTKNNTKIKVIENLNLNVKSGDFISIQGKSGCGKSTLFNIISGIDKMDSGDIISCGISLKDASEKTLSLYKNKKIGLVFQNHNLIDEFSVLENIILPKIIESQDDLKTINRKALSLMKILEIDKRAEHYPSELSGGESQRAAIARALINEPNIILCDEPTGNLDVKTAKTVESLLIDTAKKFGKTLILVSHNQEFSNKADIKYELKEKRLNKI